MIINKDELIELPINFMYILPDQTILPIFQDNDVNTIFFFVLYLIIIIITSIVPEIINILYLFYLVRNFY